MISGFYEEKTIDIMLNKLTALRAKVNVFFHHYFEYTLTLYQLDKNAIFIGPLVVIGKSYGISLIITYDTKEIAISFLRILLNTTQ